MTKDTTPLFRRAEPNRTEVDAAIGNGSAKLLLMKGRAGETKPVAPPRKSNRNQEDIQPIGLFTRRTLEVWRSVVGSPLKVTGDLRVIQELFRRMDIFPSQAQVHEMLELSRETRSHSETNFTYGAFTFYAAEMKYSERKMKCNPRRKLSCGSPSLLRKPCRIVSQTSYDVFLGGSCNPTQWRKKEAIPALKEAQVTYYNPQREDWLPNLINLEQQAKDNAKVLLFVHDKETRSLASMVEVGEWSAVKKQKLVLAIEELGDQVMNEKLSERELREMRRSRNYMRDIAEVCRIRVHTEIRQAVRSCIDIVKGNISKDEQTPLPNCDRTLGEKYIKMRSAFDNHASNNKLSRKERNLAFRVLHYRDIPKEIQVDEKPFINDTEFSMINAEHRSSSKLALYLPHVPNMFHRRAPADKSFTMHKEVFICGPSGKLDWKAKIAHPIFKKAHVFTKERSNEDAEHLMPMDMAMIEKCHVLLFVFPSDTWGAAEMIMAGYYIGLGKQVVLCTQQVCEGALVYGERLTAYQAKDYNRCRMYLSDQAMRNKVPVFDNIAEAAAKAAELAKV